MKGISFMAHDRLKLKVWNLLEGAAEGPLGIAALVVIVVALLVLA